MTRRVRATRYLLSSAVLTTPGAYTYTLCSIDEARVWLARGEVISAIGYPATANAMSLVLGYHPRTQRQHIAMEPGDEALVFRLRMRVHAGLVLSPEFVQRNCEIGLLRRSIGAYSQITYSLNRKDAMPEIKLMIRKDGTTKVMPQGFAGASCQAATKALEDALGETVDTERTGEFFQAKQSTGIAQTLSNG